MAAEPSLSQAPTPPNHPVHKTLASAANLAYLLPTGSVLVFQTLTPLFSNNGSCGQLSNKFLTLCIIIACAIFCFLSSFTDSFRGSDGKLYYGIATFNGLYVFNFNNRPEETKELMDKSKISFVDFVHAFVSLFVFIIFAFSNSNVQSCFFPEAAAGGNIDDQSALIINLPLGAGVLSSFLFTIFPTTRRGIGYAGASPHLA